MTEQEKSRQEGRAAFISGLIWARCQHFEHEEAVGKWIKSGKREEESKREGYGYVREEKRKAKRGVE